MEKRKIPDPRGYFLVWRKIWDNPLSTKPKYLAVFLYILSHANTKDQKTIIDNRTVIIKRGQWLGSIKRIAEHFGLSTSTVFRICEYLKTESILESTSTNKFTLFTVKNFNLYQAEWKAERKTNRKQIETTNKDNKDNKVNRTNSSIKGKPFGRAEVNLVLDAFKREIGKVPVDKYPRRVAWAFTQNIVSAYKKATGKKPSEEKFAEILAWCFRQYKKKDFWEKTEKLETVRLHSKAKLEELLLGLEKEGKNGQTNQP